MKTIVIVEDQTVLAAAYSNKFKGEGFNVEVALDGQEGFDLITRIRPDLVLLDLQLPKLGGLEILKKIRSNPALQALPVIVLSSLAKPESMQEAWQAGATLVLSKFNTSPKRVLESVQTTLAASSAQPQPITLIDRGSSSSPAMQTTKAGSARSQILLIEDNADLRTMMAFLLHQAGHQVTAVHSRDGSQQTKEQGFDLLLLGRHEPDSAASSWCQQIRRLCPDKPIVIYSTTALFSEQQEGLKAGATAYLVKPEDLLNVGQIATDLFEQQLVRPFIRVA